MPRLRRIVYKDGNGQKLKEEKTYPKASKKQIGSAEDLTHAERQFVHYYVRGGKDWTGKQRFNQTRAYQLAFQTENYGTAGVAACFLMQEQKIKAAIEHELEKYKSETTLDPEALKKRIIEEERRLATSDAQGFYYPEGHEKHGDLKHPLDLTEDQSRCITELRNYKDGGFSYKVYDKGGALARLERVHGMNKDTLDVTGTLTVTMVHEAEEQLLLILKKLAGVNGNGNSTG